MSDITKASVLVNGHQETEDLSANTLVVGGLKVGGTTLSQAAASAHFSGTISGTATPVSTAANWAGSAGNAIALVFNGTDSIATVLAAWNLVNPTNEATLTAGDGTQIPSAQTLTLAGGIDGGSALIGDSSSYKNFTPVSATIQGALAGIDKALSTVGSTTQRVDIFTLNGTDAINKYVVLSNTPTTPADTILVVEDAPGMFYGIDFAVAGNHLTWSGLDLDGILSSGDKLTITYSV